MFHGRPSKRIAGGLKALRARIDRGAVPSLHFALEGIPCVSRSTASLRFPVSRLAAIICGETCPSRNHRLLILASAWASAILKRVAPSLPLLGAPARS